MNEYGWKWYRKGSSSPSSASPDRVESKAFEPGSVVLLAFWLGIVVGLLEVGGGIAARQITGSITYQTLRTNWHFVWMIPVSYVVIFGALGLLLGVWGSWLPGSLGSGRRPAC